jgi:hypothetical protein
VKRVDKTGWRSPIEAWWDRRHRDVFLDAVSSAPRGGIVDWEAVKAMIETSLSREFGVAL